MKHFDRNPMLRVLLMLALSAVTVGCGEQTGTVLSLAPEETQAAGAETAGDAQGQEMSDTAEGSGASQEASGGAEAAGADAGAAEERELSGAAGSAADADALSDADAADEYMAVYICGAVITPGVYQVAEGTRLISLVELAGGFAADADETYWNLARKLEDGAMYYVPTRSETADGSFLLPTGENGSSDASSGDSAGSSTGEGSDSGGDDAQVSGAGEESGSDGLISINTATREELTTLPGIGDTKAAAIITYRETNGPFTAIDEIMNVTGIGESTYEKLKDYICL